jgi:hypothetical protein
MKYDLFICHASEDKKAFVEPFVKALKKKNLKVWYDRFELKLGDSLREKIDQGLANSKYGVVVLSKAFFSKEWPKAELDGLLSRQTSEGKKVILPIWHDVDAEEVNKFSPILASKLSARSSDGVDAIVSQIISVCNDEDAPKTTTVFEIDQTSGLREQSLEIIRQDSIIAWRKLISEVNKSIPDQLKEWKTRGESAIQKGDADWELAVIDAVNICLPGFVPIFAAIESGRNDLWKESIGILRRLANFRDEMGGGIVEVLEIGYYMLYVAGSLGMALAASLKLFDLISDWLLLRIPYGTEEQSWINVHSIHWPRFSSPKRPFDFLLTITEADHIKGFFLNKKIVINDLFLSNLICSLLELKLRFKEFIKHRNADEKFYLNIYPAWCTIKPTNFRTLTLEAFGDSNGVVNFLFPEGSYTASDFWQQWKNWKELCCSFLESNTNKFLFLHPEWLRLPGEPS